MADGNGELEFCNRAQWTMRIQRTGGYKEKNAGTSRRVGLFDFAWTLFAVAFPGKRFFGAPLFHGFQIERVTLDLLYDVFLLHFSFEAPQGAFKASRHLVDDFGQNKFTTFMVNLSCSVPLLEARFAGKRVQASDSASHS